MFLLPLMVFSGFFVNSGTIPPYFWWIQVGRGSGFRGGGEARGRAPGWGEMGGGLRAGVRWARGAGLAWLPYSCLCLPPCSVSPLINVG